MHDNSIIFQKNIQKFIHRDSTFIASIILLCGFFYGRILFEESEECCRRKEKNRIRQSKEWKRESERMEMRKRKSHVFCGLRPCSWEFRTGRTGRTSQTCPTCPTLLLKQPHIRPVQKKLKSPNSLQNKKEQLLTKLLLLFIIFLLKRLAIS